MELPSFPDNCNSLLKRFLTPEVFRELASVKTAFGVTLQELINSGVCNPDSSIGVYPGDEESYQLFSALLDPIITAYHGHRLADGHRSDFDLTNLNLIDLDPGGARVISTRIRVARNLAGLPLGPKISSSQRAQVEQQAIVALRGLPNELQGDYYPLERLSEEDRERLTNSHFLFKQGDRFLEAAGLNRDWPKNRGIFLSRDKTFLVWVNEEDQLRIISMEKGGNLGSVFARLHLAIRELEKTLVFAVDPERGYITSCPTNLGTAMRASVHIKLPKLSTRKEEFEKIADDHGVQIRGIDGEHSEGKDGIFDISNKRRLGISEVNCIEAMHAGVTALIAREMALNL